MTTIGVLALQGDFIEHEAMLRRLGISTKPAILTEVSRGQGEPMTCIVLNAMAEEERLAKGGW